jgi:purine-nucleoside phosphorylase
MNDNNHDKKFKRFFGVSRAELGETLIISPFFSTRLFTAYLKQAVSFKGMLYHGVSGMYENKKVSFVNTGMGQTLTADCVLAQDWEKNRAIIFLGAVGALAGFEIADNVLVQQAFFDTTYYEQFGIRCRRDNPEGFCPDSDLVDHCRKAAAEHKYDFKPVEVISVHTLWDQGEWKIDRFHQLGMQAIDLECALFYAAAAKKKIKALALCYVSDLLLKKPFWGDYSLQERLAMREALAKLVKIALRLAANATGEERSA